MRKKTDQPLKKVSTIPDSTSQPSQGETSDGKGGDNVSNPQKGKEAEIIAPEKSCAGQRHSKDVECHTHENIDTGMAEKRPLEIKYQHHNLRSRMKKVKKEESKETPIVSVSPASANKKEHGKSGESPKGEKTEVKKVKRWEAWTNEDTDDFFDALCEHGRDFDAIQRHIEKGHKKRGLAPEQSRNKDQVRHLYYRTCHKVFKFIEPRKDLNRNDGELHALINYGELRRKLKGIAMQKQKWRKLTELIQTGVTTLRINGRNVRLKTPVCKALKALFVKEGKEPVKQIRPQKLPAKVTIDLRPIDNATWAAVQSMSYNPRIRVNVHLQKKITSLIKVLSERMIPDGGKCEGESSKEAGKDVTPRMIFTIPHGVEVQPYENVCGKYVLDNCRAPITLKPEQIPEGYCKRLSLNEVLESALDTQEESAAGLSCLKSLPDGVFQDKTLSAEQGIPVSDILSEKGSHSQADQGSATASDSTDRLLSMTPPSQGLTSPFLFDPGGIFNGLDSQDDQDVSGKSSPFPSLSTFSSLNSGQESKFETQPQIGALVKSQKTGMVVGNTILVPPTEEVGNLANNDFMSLNSISDVNILQTDEDSGDKLDCPDTLEPQTPCLVTDSKGLQQNMSPVSNNQHLTTDGSKEVMETSPQKQLTGNTDETDLKVFSTKDDILRKGLTIRNSDHISLVDIYLMLGKPARLGFEYSFIGDESQKWKTNSMLTKLVMLAKNELNMNAKAETKFVSVATNTSPVKEEPPPQSLASRSAREINLTYKPDTGQTAPLIAQNGQLALHINPLAPDVQQGHKGSDQRKDFQFARPIAPAPIPVINARGQVNNGDGNTMSLNPSSFIVPRIRKRGRPPMVVGRILVPSASPKSSSQLFRDQPLPGQRSIRPRPIMPNNKVYGVRKVVTGGLATVASVLNNSKITGNVVASPNDILSQAAISANINPSSFNPSPMEASATSVAKPGITNAESSQVVKNLPLVLNNNKETITLAALPQMDLTSSQGSSAASSGQANSSSQSTLSSVSLSLDPPINVSVSGLSQLNTPVVVSKPSYEEPKSPTPSHMLSLGNLSGLSTPKPSDTGSDRSFMNTPTVSIHDKTSPTSAALNISPPNLASLLDISLSSVDGSCNSQDGILSGFRERLQELTKNSEDAASNVTISVAAALASTTVSVPKGGNVSPFKAGGENHWLNGENTEMSLGSLLDQLEMTPERKSVALTSSTPNSSLSIPPPVLLTESSRDSVISKDMDAHLQAMLNENSLDYVAKFADLAAHISASSTEEETGRQPQLGHTTEG